MPTNPLTTTGCVLLPPVEPLVLLETLTVRLSLSCLCSSFNDACHSLLVNPNLTLAIVRYTGAPEEEPTTTRTPGVKLDDGTMHPIASEGPGKLGDAPADVAFNLVISQVTSQLAELSPA